MAVNYAGRGALSRSTVFVDRVEQSLVDIAGYIQSLHRQGGAALDNWAAANGITAAQALNWHAPILTQASARAAERERYLWIVLRNVAAGSSLTQDGNDITADDNAIKGEVEAQVLITIRAEA